MAVRAIHFSVKTHVFLSRMLLNTLQNILWMSIQGQSGQEKKKTAVVLWILTNGW